MKRVASILFVFIVLVSAVDAAPTKEWTIAVFMNGDNDLDRFVVGDQEEMAEIGTNDLFNVITLSDRQRATASIDLIEKGNIRQLKDMGEIDMGDYRQLTTFVQFVKSNFPAHHYMVVIWNHGFGWVDKGTTRREVFKGISHDWDSGHRITTAQIGTAIAEIREILGRKLDIFAMDACLMQMAEVACVAHPNCDFIVASEESEPGDGYPYNDILGDVKKGITPAELSKTIVKRFAQSYDGGSQGKKPTTQSALQCDKLPAVFDALDGFAKSLIAGNLGEICKGIREKVQRIDDDNVDLVDFVDMMKAGTKDEAVLEAAAKLGKALDAAIIANGTSGAKVKNAKGLAIYFPIEAGEFNKEYNRIAFTKDHQWDEFLTDYYKKITTPQIIADIEGGDVSSLLSYAGSASSDTPEVNADLVERLNFRVFTEGGIPESTQEIVRNAVSQIKSL